VECGGDGRFLKKRRKNFSSQDKVLCTAFFQESAFPLHKKLAIPQNLCYNKTNHKFRKGELKNG